MYFRSKLNCDDVYLGQSSGTSKDVAVPKGISRLFLFKKRIINCDVMRERGITVSDNQVYTQILCLTDTCARKEAAEDEYCEIEDGKYV